MPCLVRRLALLSALLLGFIASRSAAAPARLSERADALVRAELERQQVPGVGIGIVKNGKVLVAKGYGFANVEHQVAAGPETLFQAGSLGKQLTAMAVMLQVEAGKLALADPLTKFFPLGDDRLYTYLVAFGTKSFRFAVSLAPDDRLTSFRMRPQ